MVEPVDPEPRATRLPIGGTTAKAASAAIEESMRQLNAVTASTGTASAAFIERATRLHERIAEVVGTHRPRYFGGCYCGWEDDEGGRSETPEFDAHVASELERIVLEERQEWLREGDALRGEVAALTDALEEIASPEGRGYSWRDHKDAVDTIRKLGARASRALSTRGSRVQQVGWGQGRGDGDVVEPNDWEFGAVLTDKRSARPAKSCVDCGARVPQQRFEYEVIQDVEMDDETSEPAPRTENQP